MHPDAHWYAERFRATELRAEAAAWRLARDRRRELPPRWAAGAIALGWALVETGLRLVDLPGRTAARRLPTRRERPV
jgi:hypothetical protein